MYHNGIALALFAPRRYTHKLYKGTDINMVKDEVKDEVEPKDEKPVETPADKPDQKTDNKDEESKVGVDETKDEESKVDTDEPEDDVLKSDDEGTEIEPELSNEFRLPTAGEQHPLNHKSTKKVIVGVLIVVVLAIIGAGALWLTHDTPVSTNDSEIIYTQGAAVTAVEGEVEYNTGNGWNLVESGTNLQEGDSLRTLDASRAIITLDEGSAIRLDGDTVVTLTKLTAEQVIVDNESGQVYTRVVPSTTRVFVVTIGDQSYEAKGTAYMTINQEDEKGVEVYQSKVDVKDKAEVSEGEAYFTSTKDAAKKEKVAKLDLKKLAEDDFLNWNKAKDESNSEFADKLGFIKDLGKKEEPKPDPTPAPEPTPGASVGISLNGSQGTDGVNLNWSVEGLSATDGFKVVYAVNDNTPTYGENSASYQKAGTYSTVLGVIDGNTYFIRVCIYNDGTCTNYSNTIQVTAPIIAVDIGTTTAAIDGANLTWSYTGTAPFGFKIVWNTSGNPTYPTSGDNSGYKYLSSPQSSSLNLADKITASGTYFVKVCKYNKNLSANPNKCLAYSEEVTYTAP